MTLSQLNIKFIQKIQIELIIILLKQVDCSSTKHAYVISVNFLSPIKSIHNLFLKNKYFNIECT